MDKLFLAILNMSLTGAFVIAAICVARLPLKKAPKIISYCLWAVAGFRLVFPFSIESVFSLIPFKAQTIPPDIAMQPIPRIDSGIPFVNNAVSSILPAATPTASSNPLQIWTAIGAWVWVVGVVVLLIYGVVSFVILKQKMSDAAHIEADIYEAENIKSPFVLGIFNPRIYLPIGLSEQEKSYIILHEQTHMKRHDHIVKFAAYFVLCLHWFNPLAWVAFLLMGVDMEMSCDERVLKEMGGETKKDYSLSLLSLATERRIIGGSPLAFGEGGIKERIKNVLRYKKPHLFISVAAIILIFVVAMALATNKPTIPAQKSFADTLLSYRTEYVGDNSKVGGLVTAIEYPSKIIYDSFELFTNDPPYTLTINFKTDTGTRNFYTGALHETPFKKNAILIFALIHNAEYITFNLDDGVNPYSIQFTRGEADSFAGGDIWNYSASIEKMEELLGKVDALSSPTIPEKTPLLDVNLVTVDVNGNSQTQISRDVRAAQLTNDWYVVDKNGDGVGYEADSFHPLQKQEGYGDVTLNLNNSGTITFLFSDNYPPQSVSVQRWNAEYAGSDSTDIWDNGEPINVIGNTFQVSDDGNDYIYEVYAKWREGDSWYVFRIDSTSFTPNSTTLPEDSQFSDQEVAAAKAVVEKYFKAWADKDEDAWWAAWGREKPENTAPFGDWTITLKDIRYNPLDSMRESYVKNGRGSVNNTAIENVIVFKCDFNVHYPDGIATSAFNEGDYTDWGVILVRQDAGAAWFIDDNGY